MPRVVTILTNGGKISFGIGTTAAKRTQMVCLNTVLLGKDTIAEQTPKPAVHRVPFSNLFDQ